MVNRIYIYVCPNESCKTISLKPGKICKDHNKALRKEKFKREIPDLAGRKNPVADTLEDSIDDILSRNLFGKKNNG